MRMRATRLLYIAHLSFVVSEEGLGDMGLGDMLTCLLSNICGTLGDA